MEFFAATMTLDMNNTDKLCTYYQDAKKNGIKIMPPDINISESDFIIDHANDAIIYSLAAIKGSGDYVVKEIVKERKKRGPYKTIFDFIERLEPSGILNRRFVEHFIKSGAFDKLHPSRRQLWESLDLIMSIKPSLDQGVLFENTYPQLGNAEEWNETEKLQNEFSAVGFYISSHPVQQYEDILKQCRFSSLTEAKELSKSRVVAIINGFSIKTTKTQTKFCILQISDSSGMSDVSMFSETLAICRDLVEVGNIVMLDLSCQKNEEQTRIIVEKMQKFDASQARSMANGSIPPSAVKSSKTPVSQILQIKIGNRNELIAVKNLIDNFKENGNYHIELLLPEKIMLPSKYFLTSYDILDLRNTVGISNVIEKN
jgi:DNA polymerase-3 subunit alpha